MARDTTRPERHGTVMNPRRYLRTPKGLTILAIGVVLVPAVIGEGVIRVLPMLGAAMLAAVAVDAPILRWRTGKWEFPDGALLTGMIVGMILSPVEPWPEAALVSAIAVLSKYAARVRRANVFNPAALALVASFHLLDTGQDWWGALPNVTPWALVLLFATGLYISERVGKMPLVVTFLGTYYALFTATAFTGDAGLVAEIYRAPDLHAALFFAFFMLTDPPTSPPKARDQVTYAVITAVVAYGVFMLMGAVYFLLAGVLAANAWEGWRKARMPVRGAGAGGR